MKNHSLINDQIDVDLQGYLAGENEPDCTTEVYDINGRRIGDGDGQ